MSKVLLVDDEPRILLLLQSLLKTNGYEIETARDGASALAIVNKGGIDITVTDLRMAGRSSLKSFLKQKEKEYIEHILVASGGDKAKAADTLKVNLSTLYRKLSDE